MMKSGFTSGDMPPSHWLIGGESRDDYRVRITALRDEAARRREMELLEQKSPLLAPADRIRLWERLHQLPLPRKSDHCLLVDIASDTGLTLEDVHAEQESRAAARVAAGKP